MIAVEQRVINSWEVRECVAAGYDDWRDLVRAAVRAYERHAHLDAAEAATSETSSGEHGHG